VTKKKEHILVGFWEKVWNRRCFSRRSDVGSRHIAAVLFAFDL